MYALNGIESKGVTRLPYGHLFCFMGNLNRNCLLWKSTFDHRNSNEYFCGPDNNQGRLNIPGSAEYVSFGNDHKTLNLGLGSRKGLWREKVIINWVNYNPLWNSF